MHPDCLFHPQSVYAVYHTGKPHKASIILSPKIDDSAIQLHKTSYEEGGGTAAKKARVEAEMFQADFDYRQALAKLKYWMGEH